MDQKRYDIGLKMRKQVLGDDRFGDTEAIHPFRRTAIDSDLGQCGTDFIRGEPVIECAAHVGGELLHFAERPDHAEIEDRTLARF